MIALEDLLSQFKPFKDYEYEGGHHKTHVPSKGRWAYLNIIFDALDTEIQREVIDPLNLSTELREFYRTYNGAHLLGDCMSIYGFFPTTYLYDRENMRKSYPYNIKDINAEYFDDLAKNRVIVVGSYGYDRSRVYADKETGVIICCVESDLTNVRATWPSLEAWITQEIARLSDCFDENGKQLIEDEETLPGRLN